MRKAKQKFHTVTMNGRRPHTERRATLFETKHFAVGEAGWGGFKVTHKRTGTGIPGLTHNRKTAERVAMAFEQRPEFARRSRRIRTFTDLAKQGVAILRRYKNWDPYA